jgi:hypothetical protein
MPRTPTKKSKATPSSAKISEILLTVSALFAFGQGALIYLGQMKLAKLMMLNLNTVSADKMAAIGLMGWGTGKATAVLSGAPSIKIFSKLNLVAMALFTYESYAADGLIGTVLPNCFNLAYLYMGFVA